MSRYCCARPENFAGGGGLQHIFFRLQQFFPKNYHNGVGVLSSWPWLTAELTSKIKKIIGGGGGGQLVKMNDFIRNTTTRSLRTKQSNKLNANFTALRTFYYDVLLLTTAYSACMVHFFLGQFPNMELILMLLSPLFLIELLYFPGQSVNISSSLSLTESYVYASA